MRPDSAPSMAGDEPSNVVPLPRAGSDVTAIPSEEAFAREFTSRHGDTARFNHTTGQWLLWDGTRYRPDQTRAAFEYVRRVLRQLGRGDRALLKASAAAGVERFAQSDEVHRLVQTDLDRDGMLLGTPGGTVDLRTGELFPARREDLITKQTSVAPIQADAPLWSAFLFEMCNGDLELVAFFQRWFGYCLTGRVTEHAFVFLYGPGGNGKSVLLNTIRSVLGGYATVTPIETLTASKHERHPTELAALHGARMVTSSETEAHHFFAEAKVKQLTGGDPVSARFMRRDFFQFDPTFKITIAGNYHPGISGRDPAMMRRLLIVPLLVVPARPDKDLEAKLRAEHGAILSWLIEGALAWQRIGLSPPQAVSNATRDYFDAQDTLGRWLDGNCDVGDGWYAPVAELHQAFIRHQHEQGEGGPNPREFGSEMKRRGFGSVAQRVDGKTAKVYRGIRMRP